MSGINSNFQTIEKLRKAVEVLSSGHVSTVEAAFEYEADGIRYYSAFTHRGGETHRYIVRVQDWFEGGEKQTWAKCNCAAGAKDQTCRHILKVGQIDAETFNRDIYLDTVVNYKAHKVTNISDARKCKGVTGYSCKNEVWKYGYCGDCGNFIEDQIEESQMAA